MHKTRVLMTMMAGERGTKSFVAEYGERLVCVRHRYNAVEGRRYKTIELIVEDIAWRPATRYKLDDVVYLRIDTAAHSHQRLLRAFGATFDQQAGLWRAKYRHALALDIVASIVPPPAATSPR